MTDRARLEKALAFAAPVKGSIWYPNISSEFLDAILAAARAHLDTLPKTKMVEVRFVARVSADAKDVFYCQCDSPESRAEAVKNILKYGGHMVILTGTAEVPA